MDESELQRYRSTNLYHCDKLLNELKREQEDIDLFFGGELYETYTTATDKVLTKVRNIRMKIRNL